MNFHCVIWSTPKYAREHAVKIYELFSIFLLKTSITLSQKIITANNRICIFHCTWFFLPKISKDFIHIYMCEGRRSRRHWDYFGEFSFSLTEFSFNNKISNCFWNKLWLGTRCCFLSSAKNEKKRKFLAHYQLVL